MYRRKKKVEDPLQGFKRISPRSTASKPFGANLPLEVADLDARSCGSEYPNCQIRSRSRWNQQSDKSRESKDRNRLKQQLEKYQYSARKCAQQQRIRPFVKRKSSLRRSRSEFGRKAYSRVSSEEAKAIKEQIEAANELLKEKNARSGNRSAKSLTRCISETKAQDRETSPKK